MTANNTSPMAPPESSRLSSASRFARASAVVALLMTALFAAAFVAAQEGTPGAGSTPAATPQATPTATMPRLELDLEELNDSGISGTVTLYDAGEQTIVEFDVEGAGGDHPAHISSGVCGDLDPEPVYELEPIDEDGESLTSVDVMLDELLDEDHAIDMRLAPDQLGTLIACANIEGEPIVPVGATPEATPDVTPTDDGVGGQVDETPAPTAIATDVPAATETPVATATDVPAATEAPTAPPTEVPVATETTVPAETPSGDVSPEADGTGGAINGDEVMKSFNLREFNDSGVSGTAILTAQGQATIISIILTGDAIIGGHIAHLHTGTCATPGDYTYTLNPIGADGRSETVVNLPFEEMISGQYMINVHPSEANWDAWMVCGELAPVAPVATTPVQTPVSGPAVTTTPPPATTAPIATTPPVTPGPVATTPPVAPGDGTAGVTGKAVDGTVQTLPQTAGVGAMLDWPSDPRMSILWASSAAAMILMFAAIVIRRGERTRTTTTSRWTRLGI